jgi:hypothetical protein
MLVLLQFYKISFKILLFRIFHELPYKKRICFIRNFKPFYSNKDDFDAFNNSSENNNSSRSSKQAELELHFEYRKNRLMELI